MQTSKQQKENPIIGIQHKKFKDLKKYILNPIRRLLFKTKKTFMYINQNCRSYQRMDQLFPLQLTHSFKCKIINSQLTCKLSNRTFYRCVTNFGIMTLIVEELHSEYHEKSTKNYSNQTTSKSTPQRTLQQRNKFITSFPFCTFLPVIYEQHIITSHKDRSVCLTLMEQVQVMKFNQYRKKVKIEYEKTLVLGLKNLQQNQKQFYLSIDKEFLQKMTFLKSIINGNFFVDFTQLKQHKSKSQRQPNKEEISHLIKELCFGETNKENAQGFNEIILIKDRLYKVSRSKILQHTFKSFFQVAVNFNFLMQEQVFIKVKQKTAQGQVVQKTKKTMIKNLTSSQLLTPMSIYKNEQLSSRYQFHFYDGYCTDLLQPVEYEQLLSQFFVDNSTYCLKKDIYLWVQRVKATEKQKLGQKKQKGDIILISQGVQKWQCINFFITYCKFVEPTLKKISFIKESNSLIFQFLGKLKAPRKLTLSFDPSYIIKDQQLSMIIQKSKLQDLTLSLSQSSITDSFLMFLANSQKTAKIKQLDISYCRKVTENGVNSLLISPFCKLLEVLNVSGTPIVQSSIESLLVKGHLRELVMNDCPQTEENEESGCFSLRNVKLIKLEVKGMNIFPTFSSNLEVLNIDTLLPVEFLKSLKDMPLKQLTLRLVQEKKNLIGGLIGTLGTFYASKQNPIKNFAQGSKASKTIRSLDLSGSLAKLKSLKPLFSMPELETLKLQNFTNIQEVDFHLRQRIIDLSLKDSQITITDLITLLKHTKILLKLNIVNTLVRKEEITTLFTRGKKYINTLTVAESQFSVNLIDSNGMVAEFVEMFEISCAQSLFQSKNQNLLSNLLFKTIKSTKNLKFVSNEQNIVMRQFYKLIKSSEFQYMKNIFVNDRTFRQAFQEYKQKELRQKKINCEQFLRVYHKNMRPQTFYLNNVFKSKSEIPTSAPQISSSSELTLFTYLYRKTVTHHPENLIQISLRNNQLIDISDAIKLIKLYNQHQTIKSIDFRNATLQQKDLLLQVIDIPHLESYNHNQYQLQFDGKSFANYSQRYLKFFMKISSIKKFKICCKDIVEVDILFQILFHCLDYHYESVEELDLQFSNVKMTKDNSSNFWTQVCELKNLKSLKISFNNCNTGFLKKILSSHHLNRSKHLETLEIVGLSFDNFPLVHNGQSVKHLSLDFQNSSISQGHLLKILKPFTSPSHLSINLSQCDSITHPNKLFSSIGESKSLTNLFISLQYCPIKELATIDFLQNLQSLKQLRNLQIDLSFTSVSYNAIASIVNKFPLKLPQCHLIIYLVGNQSKDTFIDREGLQNQGVDVIY